MAVSESVEPARVVSRRLEDKVCVITGTGGGQGRAAALRFAAEGARVVGCDIKPDGAAETLEQARDAGGEMVSLHPCDLTRPEDVARLLDLARSEFGGIDVLYNNAAVAQFAWLDDMTYEQWRSTMVYELDIVFLACKAAWPLLKERGGGAIINTGSASGTIVYRPLPGLAHSAAKAGVIAMTRHLAMEGGAHNIRANAISPGLIDTPASHDFVVDDDWREQMLRHHMLPRVGTPEDVVGCAVFLASDESAFVTGANFCVDAGTTAW
jgi:NAD(P)-dependent dehydrogenase (short-subunit alcohol dehydrogenase family)